MSERYRTPFGVEEQLINYFPTFTDQEITELKRRGIKFVDWDGFAMAEGPGFTNEWFKEIRHRCRELMSVVIAITGEPGEGKTWCGLRLCQIFDKKFDVKTQVCFSREDLARILSGEVKLVAGQAILLDEAHIGEGARHWIEELQKEVVDQLAAIRSKGLILIIVVLHLSMIDKILRQFMLKWQLHMEKRGISRRYTLSMPRFENKVYYGKKEKQSLSLPGEDECVSPDCLKCEYLDWCGNMRAIYERRKREFLKKVSTKTLVKIETRRRQEEITIEEKIDFIHKNKDLLRYTNRGTIDPICVQAIFEKEGQSIGLSQASTLAKRVQWKYPDLKPPE